MAEEKLFKCVNCGQPTSELFKTYGPSVLKLSKCDKCNGVVDKYIEYDPVIVMIDLVLMSKKAQRHVLFNTEFKVYWKLFTVLLMLETYGLWRKDSLFNILVNSVCGIQSNNTITAQYLEFKYNLVLPQYCLIPDLINSCQGWSDEGKNDDTDLFLWEKDFYVLFLSNLAGTSVFIFILYSFMKLEALWSKNKQVSLKQLLKMFSLANSSILFSLPILVWGAGHSVDARLAHYMLVFCYTNVVFASVTCVLYECYLSTAVLVLVACNCAKFFTAFYVTPFLRII